jgi:hypothetical protein
MIQRVFASLDRAPLYWIAVGLGLLVFGLNQQRPPETWAQERTEQGRLDDAFVERLRTEGMSYELLPDTPHTFGSHVLPQGLTALVTRVTGDAERAGIWLSLVGVVGVLTGLYVLAIRIYPLRGFAVVTVLAAGALGPLHRAVSPYPSTALGMALVVWGMAFFLTALTERQPHDVFASGIAFGLASYIRIEFAFVWVVLAVYLLLLQLFHGRARRHEPSAVSMALGGVLTVGVVLWPLVHRNIRLAGTPLLPGHDAELILGAPMEAGMQIATPYLERLLQGLSQLTLSVGGPGIFAGLLLPVGLVLGLIAGRHAKLPFFWIPTLAAIVGGLTALSWVTGEESYLETLGMLSPMLLPFSFLPIAFVLEQLLQQTERPPGFCRIVWTAAAAVFFLLVQVPTFFQKGASDAQEEVSSLALEFAELPADLRNATLMTDLPGPFVRAGKPNVIGTRGQTDWTVLAASTATGGFRPDELLAILEERGVELLHLSQPENPLVDRLRLAAGAPEFTEVTRLSPPHRLFSISWP